MGKRKRTSAEDAKAAEQASGSPERVEKLLQQAKSDTAGINAIVDLLELCDPSETEETVLAAYSALLELFLTLNGMSSSADAGAKDLADVSSWIHAQYLDFLAVLIKALGHSTSDPIQVAALDSLMTFVKAEAQHRAEETGGYEFPNILHERIVTAMVTSSRELEELLPYFVETYLVYDDVRHYTLKNIHTVLFGGSSRRKKAKKRKTATGCKEPTTLANIFHILHNIDMPEEFTNIYVSATPWSKHPVAARATHVKSFTDCWLRFLQQQLPQDILKAVLLQLEDDVIPHLHDPKLLADFLTDAYDAGGVLSIMSLQGLFTLMTKFHLDYPKFYPRLYDLLTPDVFHVKYRSRFFKLVDRFLTSTHIAAYVVAAFIKRLSRLSLTAPPGGILLIGRFVYNLLKRHPSCKILIHRAASGIGEVPTFDEDPYDNTADMEHCKALDSSLWEMQSLLKHYHYEAARIPKLLETPALRKMEMALDRILGASFASLFESATKHEITEAPTTFKRPTSLFNGAFEQHWEL